MTTTFVPSLNYAMRGHSRDCGHDPAPATPLQTRNLSGEYDDSGRRTDDHWLVPPMKTVISSTGLMTTPGLMNAQPVVHRYRWAAAAAADQLVADGDPRRRSAPLRHACEGPDQLREQRKSQVPAMMASRCSAKCLRRDQDRLPGYILTIHPGRSHARRHRKPLRLRGVLDGMGYLTYA